MSHSLRKRRASFEFGGQTVNLSGLGPFYEDPDRNVRRAAQEARGAYLEKLKEAAGIQILMEQPRIVVAARGASIGIPTINLSNPLRVPPWVTITTTSPSCFLTISSTEDSARARC